MGGEKMRAPLILLLSCTFLVTLVESASPQSHFLRSLKSSGAASEDHFMRALRSSHFLRTLRGSHDLQRILRSSPSSASDLEDPNEEEEFLRGLRTTGHFLRSLRSSPGTELGASGHFLRSLRDAPDTVQETDDV